jgi:hypothetical protein
VDSCGSSAMLSCRDVATSSNLVASCNPTRWVGSVRTPWWWRRSSADRTSSSTDSVASPRCGTAAVRGVASELRGPSTIVAPRTLTTLASQQDRNCTRSTSPGHAWNRSERAPARILLAKVSGDRCVGTATATGRGYSRTKSARIGETARNVRSAGDTGRVKKGLRCPSGRTWPGSTSASRVSLGSWPCRASPAPVGDRVRRRLVGCSG